jgi:hypothetical protein
MTVEVVGNDFDTGDWGDGGSTTAAEGINAKAISSVSVQNTTETAEGRNTNGEIVALAFFNKGVEVSVEGIGGDTLVEAGEEKLVSDFSDINTGISKIFVTESSVSMSQGDWKKVSVKLVGYENIT